LLLFIILLILQACSINIPTIEVQPSQTPLQEDLAAGNTPEPSFTPTFEPSPTTVVIQEATEETTSEVLIPVVKIPTQDTATPTSVPQTAREIAFLKDGDVWIAPFPDGTGEDIVAPSQLTFYGDILSYAWAPDGERFAVFNGDSICFVNRDGSISTACMQTGLTDTQTTIVRQILWSPDQIYLVLWNPTNPWDEGAIGWIILALDGSENIWRIEDPVDWGLPLAPNNEPGGFTGMPYFLPDGRLVGTLTHRWMCSSEGCRYQLYQFNLDSPGFVPYPNKPEEGWSEGKGIAVSNNGQWLANYGTFHAGCEFYTTHIDLFNLNNQERNILTLDQESIDSLAISPKGEQIIIARTAGCSAENQSDWSQVCELSQGFEVYPMQKWDLSSSQYENLIPGLKPIWSPDGKFIAFKSCLSQNAEGDWQPSANSAQSIFVISSSGDTLTLVSEGSYPSWRPEEAN
jgi:hypothetical protein